MTGTVTSLPARPEAHPILAVLVATFFVRFAFGITIAVFASYITGQSQGLGAGQVGVVGLVGALAPLGECSTVLVSGAMADRYGRFPILFLGIAGAGVLFALAATTRSVVSLGVINLLFGIASGAILAASLAIVADRANETHRGLEMGRFDAMNLAGWIGGFAVGFGALGLLANDRLGVLFLAGAILLGASLYLTGWLVRGTPDRHAPSQVRVGSILRIAFRSDVLLVTLPWLVIYMLIGTAFLFLGSASSGIGVSSTLLAVAIGAGGLVLIATQPYFGSLSDRFGRMRLMIVGTFGFVLVMVFASLLTAYGPKPALLGGVGVAIVMALAYGPAALAALADLSEAISRATTMAIYTLTISGGMVVGLAASSSLYAALGDTGLYLFFGGIAAGLVGLTAVRLVRVGLGLPVAVTTPAR